MKIFTLTTTLALAALCQGILPAPSALGQNAVPFTVLHSFHDTGPDFSIPNNPRAGLALGRDGRLYGTTYYGGGVFEGSVYAITNDGAFTVLSSFDQRNGGGAYPEAALTLGSDGLFYGTTTVSDYGPRNGQPGDGAVYSVTGGGALSILHILHREAGEGFYPYGELTQGSDGRYYGLTVNGGAYDGGTIFAVADGAFTTLHSFNDAAGEGKDGYAKLTLGRDGKLYGVTSNGNNGVDGAAFSITNDGQFTVLHRFSAANGGAFPESGLIQGSDGLFYGTTRYGGTHGDGTVYSITSTGVYTTLHEFNRSDDLGYQPRARLVQASDGRFYGTTFGIGGGDGSSDAGTIFSITSDGVFHSLHVFNNGTAHEGRYLTAELVQGTDGYLYSTAQYGGSEGDGGTVFKVGLDPATGVSSSTFFNGEVPVGNGVRYLSFPNGNVFGYYAYLSDPRYVYHFDLGYEYVFDAADGRGGVYLYDFKSSSFFYTSPTFPFPYLYDFSLNTVLYYYPDPNNPGRYNTDGTRYFYRFDTGQIFAK